MELPGGSGGTAVQQGDFHRRLRRRISFVIVCRRASSSRSRLMAVADGGGEPVDRQRSAGPGGHRGRLPSATITPADHQSARGDSRRPRPPVNDSSPVAAPEPVPVTQSPVHTPSTALAVAVEPSARTPTQFVHGPRSTDPTTTTPAHADDPARPSRRRARPPCPPRGRRHVTVPARRRPIPPTPPTTVTPRQAAPRADRRRVDGVHDGRCAARWSRPRPQRRSTAAHPAPTSVAGATTTRRERRVQLSRGLRAGAARPARGRTAGRAITIRCSAPASR